MAGDVTVNAWAGVLASLVLAQAAPATAPPTSDNTGPATANRNGAQPSTEEVDALLKELEKQAAEVDRLSTPPATAPAAPEPTRTTARALPSWMDMVVPVGSLRLRPFVRLGHPGAERHPALEVDARGQLGAEVAPTEGVAARVVLSAHPSVPAVAPLGHDVLLDAWVEARYAALGGTLSARAGRQEVDISDLVAAPNTWLQRPPRLDGVRVRVGWSTVFAQALAGVEMPPQAAVRGTLPEVNGLASVQAGLADGPGRLLELHAVLWQRRVPVMGDASVNAAEPTVLDAGGTASWAAWGAHARASVDFQQRHFEPPAILLPAGAWHLSAGYAPTFAWAMGAYVEAGTRGAWGTPGTYLPGPAGDRARWVGVRAQEYDPMLSTRHGMLGEMDVLGLRNAYGVYARAGLRRDGLRNLAVTLWRLGTLNADAAWSGALDNAYLRPGEGVRPGGLGWEVDLSATAELTRFIQLSGAVGLLAAEPHARAAGFSSFAQTAWMALDFAL